MSDISFEVAFLIRYIGHVTRPGAQATCYQVAYDVDSAARQCESCIVPITHVLCVIVVIRLVVVEHYS